MEQTGIVGLGLMGASLCKALKAAGYPVLGFDLDESTQKYAELTGTVDGQLTEENSAIFSLLRSIPVLQWTT